MLETRWQKGWARLQEFVDREGHAAVPDYHVEDGFRLGRWVSELHEMFNHWNTLPQERIEMLDSLEDWQWSWQDVYSSENNRYPRAHLEPRRTFLAMSDLERGAIVYDQMGCIGVLSEIEAIKCVGYEAGLSKWTDGKRKFASDVELVSAITGSIEFAVECGYLDKPKPGVFRAVMITPEDYSEEDWYLCLAEVLRDRPLGHQETLKRARRWVEDCSGLVCDAPSDADKAHECLQAAIQLEIDRAHIEVTDAGRLRWAC